MVYEVVDTQVYVFVSKNECWFCDSIAWNNGRGPLYSVNSSSKSHYLHYTNIHRNPMAIFLSQHGRALQNYVIGASSRFEFVLQSAASYESDTVTDGTTQLESMTRPDQ